MVHFQCRIVHAHVFYPVFESFKDECSCSIEVFVVYSVNQDKVFEHFLRYSPAPRECFSRFDCITYLIEEKFSRIVCQIAQRHIVVKKLQIFFLLFVCCLFKYLVVLSEILCSCCAEAQGKYHTQPKCLFHFCCRFWVICSIFSCILLCCSKSRQLCQALCRFSRQPRFFLFDSNTEKRFRFSTIL